MLACYCIDLCKSRTFFFFHNFDEVRPLHRTEPFGQNGADAAGDYCTHRIPECTSALEVNAQLSPSSRGTRKCAARKNSPMRVHSIGAPKTIASPMEFSFFFFKILGCQVGGAVLT